jgi:hypothetical protein
MIPRCTRVFLNHRVMNRPRATAREPVAAVRVQPADIEDIFVDNV